MTSAIFLQKKQKFADSVLIGVYNSLSARGLMPTINQNQAHLEERFEGCASAGRGDLHGEAPAPDQQMGSVRSLNGPKYPDDAVGVPLLSR